MEAPNAIVELLEKAIDYGKTSFQLLKLKVLDKTSNIVAAMLLYIGVLFLALAGMLFFSIGLALWLGDMLGKVYHGFFVVAGCYALMGICLRVFMYKWLKTRVLNFIIHRVLK